MTVYVTTPFPQKGKPMSTRTLAEFLGAAGVKLAAAPATPAAEAAPAAPAKTAAKAPAKAAAAPAKKAEAAQTQSTTNSDASSQASTEPAGGKTPRETSVAAPAQDTGKTAAQKWLAENGVIVEDAKVAEALFSQQQKLAEMERRAELEKMAEEERCRGAIFYQGMQREAVARALALGECDMKVAEVEARLQGIPVASIVKRAEELAAAVGSPALIGTDMGRAARTNDSRVMAAAEQNGNTTGFTPEAVGETRPPVSGQDEKTMRFVDVWTLPGNPGLSHGQAVDQGKGA